MKTHIQHIEQSIHIDPSLITSDIINDTYTEKSSSGTVIGCASGKESACQCSRHVRCGFDPGVRKIPWRKKWQPTPVFLPEKSQGQRSLVGYSSWGLKDSDTT